MLLLLLLLLLSYERLSNHLLWGQSQPPSKVIVTITLVLKRARNLTLAAEDLGRVEAAEA